MVSPNPDIPLIEAVEIDGTITAFNLLRQQEFDGRTAAGK
jgi:hypothetical protein